MVITNARYEPEHFTGELNSIVATIDGETLLVPVSEGNRHYIEIMRQVDAGELTIADAD